MLGSISPVGEAARRQRWGLTATAHLVAAIAGGALAGSVLGSVGQAIARLAGSSPSTGVTLGVLAIAATVGAAVDLSPVAVPSWRRQVDERWLTTYRGWVYGAGFGFQLGLGVVTTVPSAITYVALLGALLTTSLQAGLVIGAVFGAARALPVLLSGVVLQSPARLHGLVRRVNRAEAAVGRATVAAQAAVGALAAALAIAVLS